MYNQLKCPQGSKRKCKHLYSRYIEDADKEDVMRILEESFPHVYDKEEDFWRELLDINPTIILEMNGEIVGTSNIRRPQLIRNRSTSWIDLIAIKPLHRELGLGGVLLDQSESLMKEMKAKKGKLFTEEDNTSAVGFYSKHDWRVTEHQKWGYQHGHRLTMEKTL